MKPSSKELTDEEWAQFEKETRQDVSVFIDYDDKTAEQLIEKASNKGSESCNHERLNNGQLIFPHLDFQNHDKRFAGEKSHPHQIYGDVRKRESDGSFICLTTSSHGNTEHGKTSARDLVEWAKQNLPYAKIRSVRIMENRMPFEVFEAKYNP